MLFDLRGRGRRRFVKVIYGTLALLMGGGLVFFGIGSEVSGGLFDAFGDRNGGGSSSNGDQIEKAQKRTATAPRDAAAWARLAQLRYQAAGQEGRRDDTTGQFTEEGKARLQEAANAWERHLALEPARVNPNLAIQFAQAYNPLGLAQPDKAVSAYDLYVEGQAEPSTGIYSELARYAYTANQTRKGDLAADRAVELAEKDQRKAVRESLEQLKTQILQAQVAQAQATTPVPPASSTTTP